MTTTYPSPGIIPDEIDSPEFWGPTTTRYILERAAGDHYLTVAPVCIVTLGSTYGSKLQSLPTCHEHDKDAREIWDTVTPLYTTASAVFVSHELPSNGFVSQNPRFTTHNGAPSFGGGGGGTIIETPGGVLDVPAPIPLPDALPMMLAALLMIMTMKRMRR